MCVYGIMPKRRQMKRMKGGMWPFGPSTPPVAAPVTTKVDDVSDAKVDDASVAKVDDASVTAAAAKTAADATPVSAPVTEKKGLFGLGVLGLGGGKSNKKKSKRRRSNSRSKSKSRKRR